MKYLDYNDENNQFSRVNFDSELKSVPVVTIKQFLLEQERNIIFDSLCQNSSLFSGRPNNIEPCSFAFSIESKNGQKLMNDSISSVYKCLSERIKTRLPEIMSILNVEPFTVGELPLTFMNGLSGHYSLPHTDECGGRYRLSFLYYLHRNPKVFSGGDLEFYRNNSMNNLGHDELPFTRVEHQDNLLVVFPSKTFHGVTKVVCSSKNFRDGRFSAAGFIGP